MSYVRWNTPTRTVDLRGAERAYAGQLIKEITASITAGVLRDQPDRLAEWGLRYGPDDSLFSSQFGTWDDGTRFSLGGRTASGWTLALNTAQAMRSDALSLLARMHGQCEIFGWVDGPNRKWLARVIRQGRWENVLRPNMGWEVVVDMLESRDDEPCVLSYSVTEGWPSAEHSAFAPEEGDGEDDDEAFYDLPDEEQWRLGMDWIRRRPLMEWRPDNWLGYGFGSGLSAFDLQADFIAGRFKEPASA